MAAAPAAFGAQVVVTVTGVRDDLGTVRVAICPRTDFLKPACPYSGRTPARVGTVVVTIDDVPPGLYAAQAYQDANNNGILDRNWLGFPQEGMGFSNNALFKLGPPSFVDAAFTVTADTIRISFRLRYF
ncbi:DUF2141 domain-containing protein [Rhodopila sp.]|uniref:DUF2141 domain-containing protein n=1 Tax=Rhodopila sp. TaxID=2480087 RepID=UPI003D113200